MVAGPIPHPADGIEYVVLTDDHGAATGTAPKATVHTAHTPSHRAFSSFLFDRHGNLLITQRALTKKTWPGIWTNTCCGHPTLEETPAQAARRRLSYELGMTAPHLHLVLPDFKYYVEREGVVEREHCPVLIGFTDADPAPNPAEVSAWSRVPWDAYAAIALALPANPTGTPRSLEEYRSYRNLFASDAAYNLVHSLVLPGHGRVPLSEWSLWEARELLQNETFKDLMRTHIPHGKR